MEATVVPMEALGYQNYKGTWFRAGDPMEVDAQDVADMECLHMARKRKPTVQKVKAYESREMSSTEVDNTVAVSSSVAPAPTEASPTKSKDKSKRYGHREMRVGR